MKKVQIGDIFEIDTPNGKGYLHYIYNNKGKYHFIKSIDVSF